MSINYPPLKDEHLALLHHSGTSRRWEFLVQHAGRQEQQRAATSLSTLGVCWCQWVPNSEQDDDHGWIVWGGGGSDLGLWVVTFVLLSVVYVSLWTISQAALLLPDEGIPQAECPLWIFHHCFSFAQSLQQWKYPTALKDYHILHLVRAYNSTSVKTAMRSILVLRSYRAVEKASGCLKEFADIMPWYMCRDANKDVVQSWK